MKGKKLLISHVKNNILILGANEIQSNSIKHIKSLGYRTIVCDRNKNSPGIKYADKFIEEDFKNKEKLLKLVLNENINYIFPFNDIGVLTANFLSDKLNLPSNGYLNSLKQVMKFRMRKACQRHGITQPYFFLINRLEDIYDKLDTVKFPFILKPNFSGGGSRGVIKVNKYEEIESSYSFSRKYDLNKEKSVLLEEFISGIEIAIEGISNSYNDFHILTTSRKKKANTESRIDMEINYPFDKYTFNKQNILMQCKNILFALGHKKGLFHIELKIDKDNQIYFIESGSRGGGGEILSSIIPLMTDIDIIKSQIDINNKVFEMRHLKNKYSCYKFFNIKFGKLIKTVISSKIKTVSSLKKINILSKPGDVVGYFPNSLFRKDYCILFNENKRKLENDLILIDKYVEFQVEALDDVSNFNTKFINYAK
ncbi:MAG: hypothetical protein CMK56_03955 [Proteobacteria bacterium]|nr:hypothetical protein [Pseudomonadota bacterium]|tara:strand:- start:900 stop:2174 length:1275 start_codon:yes stop_codon:yes gene_type:complete